MNFFRMKCIELEVLVEVVIDMLDEEGVCDDDK